MLWRITCDDCKTDLGETNSIIAPSGYLCVECGHKRLGVTRRWIEFDKPMKNCKLKSPIQDFLIYMTEPFNDVHNSSDDEITVTLCDQFGNDSSSLLMGNKTKKLCNGEVIFSGLYVSSVGKYILKLSASGHEDVTSTEFEVT